MADKKEQRSLKKDLGLFDLFCIASGAMISSGIFVLPGLAYAKAGPAVVLAYVIASLLVIPAILSKAELATAMPKAGGTYFYIDRSMGPLMGTIGGFASWFSLAFKSAFALLGIGAFTLLLNPGLSELEIKLIAIFFCIIFTIVNLVGVKHTGKIQIFLVVALLILLAFYVVTGLHHIKLSRFTPFAPFGIASIFATAGFVFISYGGLTKVCSVAEECKEPGRTLPMGMFLAWVVVSSLYALVIFVTVGLVESNDLRNSLTPISLGANIFMGSVGMAVMAIAAILAFVSTANAGLLTASRNPLAMGKDDLLPRFFAKISKYGTPHLSIIFTSIFMIFVILFLDIEGLVKTASAIKIILFLFVILSVIIMRESRIRHYQPKFKSPLYPWIHIAGIVGYGFILIEMGLTPLLMIGVFIIFGFIWYIIYAHPKIKREYALLHVIERLTGIESTSYLIDEELREILIERDNISEKRFEDMIKKCIVLDMEKMLPLDKFTRLLAHKLAEEIEEDEGEIYRLLMKREKDSSIVAYPGIAILSFNVKGRNKFDIILVRSKKGLMFSEEMPPVYALFVIVSSSDQHNFYFHSIMWMVQISEDKDFKEKWLDAQNSEELRDIILSSWVKQKSA